MRLLAALLLLGCKPGDIQLGAQTDAGADPEAMLPARGLNLTGCESPFEQVDLSGAWVFLIEAASEVEVDGRVQPEIASRYGVAEICQSEGGVSVRAVVCTYALSPVFDDDLDCSAMLPSGDLIALLPEYRFSGTFAPPAIGGELAFEWHDRWGLADGASVPAEPPQPEDTVEDGTIDQDEDGDPGVTVRGDGVVPTVGWAAQEARIAVRLQVDDREVLNGSTRAAVAQSILGGPAARDLRGRSRSPADGGALFVRAEGQRLGDANRDGRFTCAEFSPFLGPVLPAPRDPVACRR